MITDEIINLTKRGEAEYISEVKELDLPQFVWIPEFISLTGSILYDRENNREPNDIDIVIRANEEAGQFSITLDSALKLKIDRILEQEFGGKSTQWVGNAYGPNWRYRPIYDLALIPHQPVEIREINEPVFADRLYKEDVGEPTATLGFKKIDKSEKIVGGIVYPANTQDSQGDWATPEEIWKMLKKYMISKRNTIKVMHEGVSKDIPIVECFQAEEDTHKGGSGEEHLIRKGDWYISVYLGNEPKIWNDVVNGKLTGFSMMGYAQKLNKKPSKS